VTLQHEVDRGFEERVSWAEQLRTRLLVHPVLLETHALVALEDWGSHPDVAVALPDGLRDVGDLPAALLSPVDLAPETWERIQEERLDRVRRS